MTNKDELIEAQEHRIAALLKAAKAYCVHEGGCETRVPYGRLVTKAPYGRYWRKREDRRVELAHEHVCGLSGFGAAGDVCAGCSESATDVRAALCSCGLDATLAAAGVVL